MQAFCAALRRFPAPFRVAVFIALFIAAAAPLVLPVYLFEYRATAGRSIIWAPVCLSGIFLPVLWSWMRWVHKLRAPLRTLGVGGRWWWKLWGVAFLAGTASVAVLCLMQLIFGWSRWGTAEPAKMVQTVLEGFGVALLVGGAEELLFRGWLLYELEQDYSLALALWLNAILFAVAHYLRPIAAIVETWPQFLGLLLLGLTLVWARRIPVLARPPKTTLWLAVGLHRLSLIHI